MAASSAETSQTRIGGPRLDTALTLRGEQPVTALAWSTDGQRIATASDFGRDLTLWDAQGKRAAQFRREFSYIFNSLAFLAGGDTLLAPTAANSAQEASVAMSAIDMRARHVAFDIQGPAPGQPVWFNRAVHFAISADRSRLAAITSLRPDQPVSVYDTRDFKIVATLRLPAGDSPKSVAFTPDATHAAVGSTEGRVYVFDVASPDRATATIEAYTAPPTIGVEALSFSRDGALLAAGGGLIVGTPPANPSPEQASALAPVKVFRVHDGALSAAYPGPYGPIRDLSWGDGNVLAAAAGNHSLHLLRDGQDSAFGYADEVMAARFAPDGKRLAVAAGKAVAVLTVQP